MRRYKILPHTAEWRIKVEGDSLEELFRVSMEAMTELMTQKSCADYPIQEVEKTISITADNETVLLIDFLSEILTVMQTEKVVFCKIQFLNFSSTTLEAKISGAKIVEFKEDVKAVTYHEAKIEKNSNGFYETNLVFDI